MHSRAIATAALCLGLAAGCSSDGEPGKADPSGTGSSTSSASGSPAASDSPTAVTVEPADGPVTAFDATGHVTFPETGVRDAAAGETTVLTLTSATLTARTLPELAGAYALTSPGGTYTDLWAPTGERFGYLLDVSTELGTGTRAGEDRITVTRFDVATGEVTGEVTTRIPQDPHGSSAPALGKIVAVQGSRVVVDSAAGGTAPIHAAAVLDLADGKTVWRARGAQALGATRRLVLLTTGRPDVPGEVEARSLGSGDLRWRALPGTLSASLVGTTARSVVVARDDNVFTGNSVTTLALRSGRDVTTTATADAEWACAPGARTIAVCSLPGSKQVVGWDLDRHRPAWTLPTAVRFAPLVTLVSDGLVYGILDSGIDVVLDARTGKDVGGAGGAAPVAVNGYGGVVLYGDRALFVPRSESGRPVLGEPAAPQSPTASASPSEPTSAVPTGPSTTPPSVPPTS